MEFLSPQWRAALVDAAAGTELAGQARLTVAVVVTEDGADDVGWALAFGDGGEDDRPGAEAAADVTFTIDRATATAMSRGQLGAQDAFMAGRLRIGGDLSALLAAAGALEALGDVFAPVRERTIGDG